MTPELIEIKKVLDDISPTFCAAKFYGNSIYLDRGVTRSCCHCASHKINTDNLFKESATFEEISNTQTKKDNRRNLLNGVQDSSCVYCWNIENVNPNLISDRLIFSSLYKIEEIKACPELIDNPPIKILQIVFDNLCNLGCLYCNREFSSTWQTEIKMVGVFKNLSQYSSNYYSYIPEILITNEERERVQELFWKWLEKESSQLKRLMVSGGEPTMSPNFWKMIDIIIDKNLKINMGINTNLMIRDQSKLTKIINLSNTDRVNFKIATSNEAIGAQAEFLRDGLEWDVWISNMHRCLSEGTWYEITTIATINCISLFTIIEFLDEIFKLTNLYPKTSLVININKLEGPQFLNINCLLPEILSKQETLIKEWAKNTILVDEIKYANLVVAYYRLISIIKSAVHKGTGKNDFKSFIDQYEIRRGKNFNETFKNYKDLIDHRN